jgi:hypothetical protein
MTKQKTKRLPNLIELMERIGHCERSVSYGDSRTVLKYLNKPVVGYCLGMAAFIAIFKNIQGFGYGVCYSIKHFLSKYPVGGFSTMDLDKAVKLIKTHPLAVERAINKQELEKVLKHRRYTNVLLGEVYTTEETTGDHIDMYRTRVYEQKNKKLVIKRSFNYADNYTTGYTQSVVAFAKYLSNAKTGMPTQYGKKIKITKNTLPKDIEQKILLYGLAQEV